MNARMAFGPARRGFWLVTAAVIAALALTVGLGRIAVTQTPPPAPKAPAPAPAPKAAPKAPAQAPAQPAQPQQQAGAPAEPPLIWSAWAKLCSKGPQENSPQVCATSRDGRTEVGFPVVVAAVIENESTHQKVLRVSLPLGMVLQQPMRVVIDDGQPMNGPYVLCTDGCMADFEASAELVGKMKKGQSLIVGGVHFQAGPMQVKVPLADFAKTNDGAPTDPKVLEAAQKKQQEVFQKNQEEFRKKMEAQQQGQLAAPAR
jgi:invasion protein IalB